MIISESDRYASADAPTLSFSHCASLPRAPRHPDEQDADPQTMGMPPIGLRRKRAPVIASPSCAAQYFVESVSRAMLAMIPAHLGNHGEPQPKF
jgi:hypothetical protein